MSISSAPSATACSVSQTFSAVFMVPIGKLTQATTLTGEPLTIAAAAGDVPGVDANLAEALVPDDVRQRFDLGRGGDGLQKRHIQHLLDFVLRDVHVSDPLLVAEAEIVLRALPQERLFVHLPHLAPAENGQVLLDRPAHVGKNVVSQRVQQDSKSCWVAVGTLSTTPPGRSAR